jgi:DNA-binding NarL/FixJ family response regulator
MLRRSRGRKWSISAYIPSNSFSVQVQAVPIGIRGILSKSSSLELHLACLRTVSAGKFWIENGASTMLMFPERNRLTARQQELMGLLSQGFRNKEIARRMGISVGSEPVEARHQ